MISFRTLTSFVCLILVIRFAVAAPLQAQQRTITVIGHASEQGKSSEGKTITIRVSGKESTATLAYAKLADQIREIKKAVIAAGATSANISEGEVAVNPSYDYSKPGLAPAITGYQISRSINILVERDEDAPKIIDAATGAGASSVALGEAKEEKDDDEGALQLRALKDAHERAEELAKQLGATLGDVLSVSTVEAKAGPMSEEQREEQEHRQNSGPEKESIDLKVTYLLR